MNAIESLPSYEKFIGVHEGETACIFGAGTSVANQDFSFTSKYIQISVNSSILLMDWELGLKHNRYWVSNDSGVLRWDYWKKVIGYSCNRIIRDSWKNCYNGFDLSDFYVFYPRPTAEDIINPEDKGLAYCSSVPTSLDLAIQMGCKRIFLFGVDQYFKNGKSHYWQYWPEENQPKRGFQSNPNSENNQKNTFDYNRKAFKALRLFADGKKVDIFNCNTFSKVEYFNKISIDDARKIL